MKEIEKHFKDTKGLTETWYEYFLRLSYDGKVDQRAIVVILAVILEHLNMRSDPRILIDALKRDLESRIESLGSIINKIEKEVRDERQKREKPRDAAKAGGKSVGTAGKKKTA